MQPYQQESIVSQRIIPDLTPDEVIAELNQIPLIAKYWKKNTKENQKSLIDVFMRLPSKADCPGFIYGFRQKKTYNSQDKSYWIKMGRTKRSAPQDRIFQWEKDDKHQYNEVFTVRSQFNNKLELLVHLVFAYARKPIKINDKLRIEWFQFEEKVPTAAVTNLVNTLMEKIHQKYIDRIEEPSVFHFYDGLLEKIVQEHEFIPQDFRIVAFGLPKTGKSLLSKILQGDELNVLKDGKGISIESKASLQQSKYSRLIEIEDTMNESSPEEATASYFHSWQKLCSLKHLLPILIVKQSDIESSKLLGLTHGLSLLERYIKPSDKLLIVVTHARTDCSEKAIREELEENQCYLTKEQSQMFFNSEFIIIKKPQQAGLFIQTSERQEIEEKINKWAKKVKENDHSGLVEFKLQKEYLNVCHQIIKKSYLALQMLLAEKFKQRFKELSHQGLQETLVQKINSFLQQLKKTESSNQLAVHRIIEQMVNLLSLTKKEQIQIFLYVFCELCSNKTMEYSLITALLSDQVNEKIIEFNYKTIGRLDSALQVLRNDLAIYVSKYHEDLVPKFIQVMEETSITTMIKILNEVVEEGQKSKQEEICMLVKSLEKLLIVLVDIEEKMKKGLRLQSSLGKVRQAIYFGLKGLKDQTKQENIKKVEPYKEVSQRQEQEEQKHEDSQQHWSMFQENSFAALSKKIDDVKEGTTVVNIVKQFRIEAPPKQYKIRHNMFIVAKEVKIYNDCSVTFKGVYKPDKRKLKLILLAERFVNHQKLSIPGKSLNGLTYLLSLNDDKIQQVVSPARKEENNQTIFDLLKQLYNSRLK